MSSNDLKSLFNLRTARTYIYGFVPLLILTFLVPIILLRGHPIRLVPSDDIVDSATVERHKELLLATETLVAGSSKYGECRTGNHFSDFILMQQIFGYYFFVNQIWGRSFNTVYDKFIPLDKKHLEPRYCSLYRLLSSSIKYRNSVLTIVTSKDGRHFFVPIINYPKTIYYLLDPKTMHIIKDSKNREVFYFLHDTMFIDMLDKKKLESFDEFVEYDDYIHFRDVKNGHTQRELKYLVRHFSLRKFFEYLDSKADSANKVILYGY